MIHSVHPRYGLQATHISQGGWPSLKQRPARRWQEGAPTRTEHPPRPILAVQEADHLNQLVHRSTHLAELSLQLAKRVPPASFSTAPIKQQLDHPQRHCSAASRGARTAPTCRHPGRNPSKSTGTPRRHRHGDGREPPADRSPCPGLPAFAPAQVQVHLVRTVHMLVPGSENSTSGSPMRRFSIVR